MEDNHVIALLLQLCCIKYAILITKEWLTFAICENVAKICLKLETRSFNFKLHEYSAGVSCSSLKNYSQLAWRKDGSYFKYFSLLKDIYRIVLESRVIYDSVIFVLGVLNLILRSCSSLMHLDFHPGNYFLSWKSSRIHPNSVCDARSSRALS